MKTSLLAIVFSLGVFNLQAQITITTSDMPQPGDSIRVSLATGTTVAYASTGPNFLWDFSSLTPNAQQMLRYQTPANLPFTFLSTVSIENPSPDSLPGIGTVPSNFTDYFKNGNSGYRQNGISFEYTALLPIAIPVIYSSPDYVFRFPMNYGNTDTSDAAYSFNVPNLAYIGQTSHRVNEVDGWGALITPYGIFNTIRVKSTFDATDTISIDTLGTGFSIPRPTQIQYKWLAAGMKIPVLEIDANLVLNTEVISTIRYQDSLRDSVFQVGVPQVVQNIFSSEVFPNPASGNCNVIYHLEAAGNVGISITDLSGRTVKTISNGFENEGTHVQEINLDGLGKGLYFLQINSGSSSVTKKIVVGE